MVFMSNRRERYRKYRRKYMVPLECIEGYPGYLSGGRIRAGLHEKNASIIFIHHLMICDTLFPFKKPWVGG